MNSSDTPAEQVLLALLISSGTLQKEGTTAIKIKQKWLIFVKVYYAKWVMISATLWRILLFALQKVN